jgi:hypothetical protein
MSCLTKYNQTNCYVLLDRAADQFQNNPPHECCPGHCVGDSITMGSINSGFSRDSYSKDLQKQLGIDYQIVTLTLIFMLLIRHETPGSNADKYPAIDIFSA